MEGRSSEARGMRTRVRRTERQMLQHSAMFTPDMETSAALSRDQQKCQISQSKLTESG